MLSSCIENPRVDGSIPPLATSNTEALLVYDLQGFVFVGSRRGTGAVSIFKTHISC
jgi:hypothetical protein